MSQPTESGAGPVILVTNDDGYQAAGLAVLAEALGEVGRVRVLAPETNWSAAGHSKTMHKPLRVQEVRLEDGRSALACSGSPSDCVALALLGLVSPRPALVVSGINPGCNVGQDLTYSGTVAAAMEGAIWGVPSMAVSLDWREGASFAPAARVAARLARVLLERAPAAPAGRAAWLLNVNVPALEADRIAGVQLTRQGQRVYRDALIERRDPRGRAYYWIGGDPPEGVAEPGSDIGALAEGYVSVTPLTLDLTDYAVCEMLSTWEL